MFGRGPLVLQMLGKERNRTYQDVPFLHDDLIERRCFKLVSGGWFENVLKPLGWLDESNNYRKSNPSLQYYSLEE